MKIIDMNPYHNFDFVNVFFNKGQFFG
ncbi:uncharacterized protein METZ01_LOCUS478346 [marine metagenome]|uniref:Uncharacterized protein n=1 Tax=marine metagenome TaxID=408172 RepID=A0A383C005_9ZZZZ